MFVKNINDCPEFTANDGCKIQEWLHPKNDAVELPYSVAMATVDVGEKSYKHKLQQAETYLILSGTGIMHIDDNIKNVIKGDAVYIPPDAICVYNFALQPLLLPLRQNMVIQRHHS